MKPEDVEDLEEELNEIGLRQEICDHIRRQIARQKKPKIRRLNPRVSRSREEEDGDSRYTS